MPELKKDQRIQELLAEQCLCDYIGRECARCKELQELTDSTISTFVLNYPDLVDPPAK